MRITVVLCLATAFAAYSGGERCGTSYNGLLCDPQGKFGACCSQTGYCGSTPAFCSVENGCQSGCVAQPVAPPEPISPGCGDGVCDPGAETCASCARDCGVCNLQYLDKCITPGHVALTFDDGPDQYAPNLMAIAKKLDVKLTLFVIGSKLSNVTHQSYLKQYYEAGHTIASHTFTHPYLTQLNDDQIRKEMTKTDDAISSLIGVRPVFMRNPYADTNDRTMALLQSMGYQSIFTSLDTEDTVNANASGILGNVATGLLADPSAKSYVVTQHETLGVSVNSLLQIVNYIQQRNYTVVDIATCFGTAAYRD